MSGADHADESKTKRLALFRNVEHGFDSVFAQSYSRDDDWCMSGWIRVSGWVDVTFEPLADDKQVEAALSALAQERARVVKEFTVKLARLDEQAANFRALTAPVQS